MTQIHTHSRIWVRLILPCIGAARQAPSSFGRRRSLKTASLRATAPLASCKSALQCVMMECYSDTTGRTGEGVPCKAVQGVGGYIIDPENKPYASILFRYRPLGMHIR